MQKGARALGWLQKAVLGVFFAAICAGMFLPIYTDEVGWRFQERAGIDGVDKLFSDLCGPNTLAAPPFFMMPVRYYSAFFNTMFADPFYVRLSGVGYALLATALLFALIRRLSRDLADRRVLATIGVGLLSLGTLPLLLVWSRPEQPLLLATIMALLIALKGESAGEFSSRTAWWRSIGILLLGVIAFSYHLKGLFLTPALLACLFFASRGRDTILPRLIVATMVVGLAGWSADYWVHRLQCPDDPVLAGQFAKNNMGVELARARNPGEIAAGIGKIIGNVDLPAYFELPTPRPRPLSSWLEPNQISSKVSGLWETALFFLWSGVGLAAAIGLCMQACVALRQRRLAPRPVLALALLGTAVAWSATQTIRNFYEATFVLPLLVLAIVLALPVSSSRSRSVGRTGFRMNAVAVLAGVVGVAAIVSMLGLAAIYAPSVARANTQKAYIRAQPFSLPVFGYGSVKPDIMAAAAKCGIREPASAHALMIDDLTYFTFMESRLPQHRLGVVSTWRGSIKDPVAYLRGRGSSGAVLGCHLLPEDLRRRAKRTGAFCCLGPPNW